MRKLIILTLCLTLALLVGYSGYRGYRVWKQHHLITLAKEYLGKSDGRNAVLCLRQVLQTNPYNREAARMMATLCEATHDPAALLWRSRAVEINPHSLDDRLALARTALAMHDARTATNALYGVDQAGRQTPDYHETAATVALMLGNLEEAAAHFQEVARLKPQDPVPQLNLAQVHLRSTNAHTCAEARAMLNVLCLNPTNAPLRCQALRELVTDAVQNKKMDLALSLSKQLLGETNSTFNDQLLQLRVLQAAQSPEFKTTLATCQKKAASDRLQTYELASWQMTQMSFADALAWMKTLPASIQTNQPVALLCAECREATRDWQGLESSLSKQNWADIEFIRLALRTRALRSLQMTSAAKLEWDQALSAANGQKQNMITLLQLAEGWKWASDAEDILWRILNRYPNERWAAQALIQASMATGQTRSLLTLFSKEVQISPSNVGAKNNLAMIALLLDAQEHNPHTLAREVYQSAPTNSGFASTYAFSLYLQKKNAEARKILESLTPSDLEAPSVAGYYALILQADGDKAKARKYFNLATKATLLPEERKIMEKARAS